MGERDKRAPLIQREGTREIPRAPTAKHKQGHLTLGKCQREMEGTNQHRMQPLHTHAQARGTYNAVGTDIHKRVHITT